MNKQSFLPAEFGVPQLQIQHSALDASVNFIQTDDRPGAIEARYVRREDEYFIAYLSSHRGCAKACRFCHLTQSGQTDEIPVSFEEYLAQARLVLEHYQTLLDEGGNRARKVHFNWMSRGDVFANRVIHERGDELLDALSIMANQYGLIPSFKLSTIMPAEMDGVALSDIFRRHRPDIYYSLYSMDEGFRRRWMPKALDAQTSLQMLAQWQDETRKIPVIHWALIADVNDSESVIDDIIAAVNAYHLRVDVNLVRYNPFSAKLGHEPDEATIMRAAEQLSSGLPGSRVKIVGRVGHDVKASCGMFVAGVGARKPAGIMQLPILPSSHSQIVRQGAASCKSASSLAPRKLNGILSPS